MSPHQFKLEFHVSRQSRDLYQFDEVLFATNGNVIFANFHGARLFAQRMNDRRDLVRFPEQAVRAGQINALGLVDELLHRMVEEYRRTVNPKVMAEAIEWMEGMLGPAGLDDTLRRFAADFPPVSVYRREQTVDEYFSGETAGFPNRELLLEEMLMLWLSNVNPACSPYLELFGDDELERETDYNRLIPLMHAFFETQPTFGAEGVNLIDMLRAPALASPHSLAGQLEFIRQRWGAVLGKFLYRLLSSMDLIREEEKPVFGVGGGGDGSHIQPYEFSGIAAEPEAFSPDRDWMPSLVLMAKNAYVWLDQLSKKYQMPLTRLDQIPDEELDALAQAGFTGLWLIGLWERSVASKTIKQMRGNPEAVASAYSLMDYAIAQDLGGEEGYEGLREKAWRRGIRLASDMVPNHMGIDSRWVVEHPDWFLSLDYPPFPSYTYNGPNLSWDGRVGIYLEDHYFNNSDAAVTFKRVDFWSGSTKYIYHGNDGTSMPWNDTAQLNYLLPAVRESVIQTILHVARKFPVIRFDAAMTLAKRHVQRLWFPEPGTGGDIASRAEFGLTKEQFDAAMPAEFWREVVDRVAAEVPDTLLLAEAFWMMEGYFVRTLGMHRVYNSAFMNMLRDEKNSEYRLAIKNTLEFDPEILKRYVNFMSNPDERTAVDQFGKGDKYFGISILMSTLPGLPMYGHGQLEGFTEKYGMEYRRAYWEESVDSDLMTRHQREIFPLLRKRYLFAEVQNFLLYDLYAPEGHVNEEVFAYSNRSGDERSLVIYHNKFANARGWLRTSAAYSVKGPDGSRSLTQRSLGDGLGLENRDDMYTIFRDQISGLEYIRNNRELHEQGLHVELEAYKVRVYLDFRQVQDNEWRQYAHLAAYLGGGGVPNMEEAMKEIFLQPIHGPFRELVNAGMLHWLIDNRLHPQGLTGQHYAEALAEVDTKLRRLLSEIKRLIAGEGEETAIAAAIQARLGAALRLPRLALLFPAGEKAAPKRYAAALTFLGLNAAEPTSTRGLSEGQVKTWAPLLDWVFTHRLGEIADQPAAAEISRSWLDEWLLGKIMVAGMSDSGIESQTAWGAVTLNKILTSHHTWWQEPGQPRAERKPKTVAVPTVSAAAPDAAAALPAATAPRPSYLLLQRWLNDSEVQRYCGFNRHQGILWFNKEAFEDLLWWLFAAAVVDIWAQTPEGASPAAAIAAAYELIEQLVKAEQASEYQVEKLLAAAR